MAIQSQILGIAGGTTVRDLNCERLKLSRALFRMGMKVGAVAMLCQDERVFASMEMAGTPCPYSERLDWKRQKVGRIILRKELTMTNG